jgi:linoleoyl-CoA desaturase
MASKKSDSLLKLQFDENNQFKNELQKRVDEYFLESGRSPRDNLSMYIKTFIILALFSGLYILLVFFATEAWQAVVLSVLIGFAVAGIGFNIQHDGGHNAYSKHAWINKIMAMTLDIIGGSSYFWKWKHVVFHHRYVNITGYDPDIELAGYGRLSPHNKYRAAYKWQHIYLWLLYGFLVFTWHFVSDFRTFITGRITSHPVPRPKGRDLVIFIAGKIVFASLAFVIPLMFHPLLSVIACYAIAIFELGIAMSLIFQMPHCVEEADFPLPRPDTGRMETSWAVHQANVTLDFERRNPILTWFLGGLNFHKEHHLFPVMCHVNYPAISRIVQQTCRDFGIEYKEHSSFRAALSSHYRWIRRMGMQDDDKRAM